MTFDRLAEAGACVPVDELADVRDGVHRSSPGDFVSMEDGTGIVHIAPAFGGEDFELGKENGLLFLQPVDLRGRMAGGLAVGRAVREGGGQGHHRGPRRARADAAAARRIKHTYPFCWRCDTPLLYYAKPTWYIRTTAVKDQLIEGNEQINWYPEHIKRRPLRRLAAQQRRLGALAASATGARRCRSGSCDRVRRVRVHRLARDAAREGRRSGSGRRARGPPPPVHRPHRAPLRELRRRRCAGRRS